jgi:hypothetical protein
LYGPALMPEGPEALLVRALERKGAAVVPVSRDERRTVLVVVVGGAVALMDLAHGRGAKAGLTEVRIGQVTIPMKDLGDASAADEVTGMLLQSIVASSPAGFR